MRNIIVLLVLSCSALYAKETATYDMILWGDKVGKMLVTHDVAADGTETYYMETHSRAKVLWIDKDVSTWLTSIYKNGKLISSTDKEIENGKITRWTNVKFNGTNYTVEGSGGKRTFTEAPVFSILTLYFKPVAGITRIFHEGEGTFCELKNTEPGTYEFKGEDARNVYHYVNGRLNNMEFHVSIATVKAVRTS